MNKYNVISWVGLCSVLKGFFMVGSLGCLIADIPHSDHQASSFFGISLTA